MANGHEMANVAVVDASHVAVSSSPSRRCRWFCCRCPRRRVVTIDKTNDHLAKQQIKIGCQQQHRRMRVDVDNSDDVRS